MTIDVLYRYYNNADVVRLATHKVIRRTLKGAWINYEGEAKFILNDAAKRFAYPTQAEAKKSFLRRKRRQLAILKDQLRYVEQAVKNMKDDVINGPSIYNNDFFQD